MSFHAQGSGGGHFGVGVITPKHASVNSLAFNSSSAVPHSSPQPLPQISHSSHPLTLYILVSLDAALASSCPVLQHFDTALVSSRIIAPGTVFEYLASTLPVVPDYKKAVDGSQPPSHLKSSVFFHYQPEQSPTSPALQLQLQSFQQGGGSSRGQSFFGGHGGGGGSFFGGGGGGVSFFGGAGLFTSFLGLTTAAIDPV